LIARGLRARYSFLEIALEGAWIETRRIDRMRLVGVVTCVIFFAASGSALAADCNKGMLWPFVRNPGDCLTDVEMAAGKTGVYSGPVNTNVDVSAIKPATTEAAGSITSGPVGNAGVASLGTTGPVACNKGWLWPFVRDSGDCLTETERKTNGNGVFGGGTATQASLTQPATSPNLSTASLPASSAGCSKGWLWPFVRDSGDCLTETERKSNGNGVYGGGAAAQVSVTQPANAPNASTANPPASAAGSSSAACSKGLLWPFVRDAGDCLTEAEIKNKGNGVYGGGASTQVSAMQGVSAPNLSTANVPANAPAPVSAPTPAACSKGWLWPFVRQNGDCPTETGKK
jgi:pyruvate/2-oxoglutarate dehydrogenase complex dihydrolipoamide acyltransferase (E2) component